MKIFRKFLLLSAFLIFTFNLFAQKAELLESLPGDTKEEFIKSEPRVLATINWLENTPLNQEEGKRKQQYALLTAWIVNSPTVTIEVNSNVLTFTKKNSELLIIFMGGWTKYVLENSYSKDDYQGNLAGVRSAVKVYKMGNGLKKDKAMDKLIAMEENGELEKWIKDQMEKK
jgi:hypothetical protein